MHLVKHDRFYANETLEISVTLALKTRLSPDETCQTTLAWLSRAAPKTVFFFLTLPQQNSYSDHVILLLAPPQSLGCTMMITLNKSARTDDDVVMAGGWDLYTSKVATRTQDDCTAAYDIVRRSYDGM